MTCCTCTPCSIDTEEEFFASDYDTLAIVSVGLDELSENFPKSSASLKFLQQNDSSFNTKLQKSVTQDKLVLFKSCTDLSKDWDDVRTIQEAGNSLIKEAISCGRKKVLLFINTTKAQKAFEKAHFAFVQGALAATYVPYEVRIRPEFKPKPVEISLFKADDNFSNELKITEEALTFARDLGGSDPETMAPQPMADFILKKFADFDNIKIETIRDQTEINKSFPCFDCVNRATRPVPKHHGVIMYLTYSEGNPEKSLFICGKGVTYDTGGADLKVGGAMPGMHRDKCGASNALGLIYAIGKLKPKNIRVTVAVALIRNSLGSHAYVADEIVKSRAGIYLRVGNTDAEGRMAMVDVLCSLKERALLENAPNPHFFTWATLTGHACVAVGLFYTIAMDNGPARKKNTAEKLQASGEKVADPIEISRFRREDYRAVTATDGYSDVIQDTPGGSIKQPRGHQFPAAFMDVASGLSNHGCDSDRPLPYTHIDCAPSAGPYPGMPTGCPMLCFLQEYVLDA